VDASRPAADIDGHRSREDGHRSREDGHRSRETVAFAPPAERDGASVITATALRTHTATRADGAAGQTGFDAQMAGSRPIGAFVPRNGRVRWDPALDWTRLITTAEVMVGGVLIARCLTAARARRRPASRWAPAAG
jgi:hypothetical protein